MVMGFEARSEEPGQTPDTASPSLTEQFKTFLASPPTIKSLIFKLKSRPDVSSPAVYDGSFSKSTNWTLYKAVWQQNAVLFHDAPTINSQPEFLSNQSIVCIYDTEHWLFNHGRDIETCTATQGTFDNSVTRVIGMKLWDLYPPFQGGIFHVRPGDLKWSGDHFEAAKVGSPFDVTFRIKGSLTSSNGLPYETAVTYSTGDTVHDKHSNWRIRYFYDKKPLPFYPSSIKGYVSLGDREVEMYECDIEELIPSESNLDRSLFDAKNILSTISNPSVHVFTNGIKHVLSTNGALIPIPYLTGASLPKETDSPSSRVTGLSTLFAFNFSFLAYFSRRDRRNRTN